MTLKGIPVPRGTALLPLALLGGLLLAPRGHAQVASIHPPMAAPADIPRPSLPAVSPLPAPAASPVAEADLSLQDITAAKLALAAHRPWADFQDRAVTLPDGWRADLEHSGRAADGTNHFIAFHNAGAKQVVIAFRGTNSFSQLRSDLFNDGGAAWESLRGELARQMPRIREAYPDSKIVTDGHSLGGGLAQTAALEFGLDGYGQNSTPVSGRALKRDFSSRAAGRQAISAWRAAGHVFREINQRGDWVGFYYRHMRHRTYIQDPRDATVLARPSRHALRLPLDLLHPRRAHTIHTIIQELAGRGEALKPSRRDSASSARLPMEGAVGHVVEGDADLAECLR
ncbi:MAG: hypothetical protein PW734_03030 [Verrucomicrobium sp.]|nr:hypothetical protein [Verrucomicrobium sp.]